MLKYVKGAVGETDVPDALPEFISQRRRWLNGSFFAAVYAVAHVGQIMRSGHSLSRKVALMVETVYNIINMVFSWFGIVSFHSCLGAITTEKLQGNFYLFFVGFKDSLIGIEPEWSLQVVLSSSLEDKSFGLPSIKYFNAIVQYFLASIIIACFLLSMGNKPKA